tara:strand:- start:4363 stop:5187 length:825 start_codon:yes stop_codon:yes gene_type:complete
VHSDELGTKTCLEALDPTNIVVAGGSITEILYFIEQENRIIGVDVTSNYPKEAKKLPSIGYVRSLSTEGILSLNPKLILGENDMGPPLVINQLKEINMDLRIIPEEQTSYGIVDKIKCVASILGCIDSADIRVTNDLMPTIMELETLVDLNESNKKNVMLILSMQGTSPIVAGRGTSGDNFIKMAGAKNVFDSFDGWKPVSEESIINVNPEFFIIPSRDMHKGSNVKNLTTNPIFINTEAGANKNFIFEDSMAMLGFGPRTIDIALKVAKKLYP